MDASAGQQKPTSNEKRGEGKGDMEQLTAQAGIEEEGEACEGIEPEAMGVTGVELESEFEKGDNSWDLLAVERGKHEAAFRMAARTWSATSHVPQIWSVPRG
jgi:hypothetical protein